MKFSCLLCASLLQLIPMPQPVPPVLPAQEIHGEWVLAETSDATKTDKGDANIRMILEGTTVRLMFAGHSTNRGSFKVTQTKNRKVIEMKLQNGRSVWGLYELQNGSLVMCVCDRENALPTTIAPSGQQWQERWVRAEAGTR